jgi:glutathione S-transferase
LREKRIDFDIYEVDLRNKSEEFLRVSPYGRVPVLVVNRTSLYESNIVNEYLDEVYKDPQLMGYEREFSEEQVQEALEKLRKALLRLEHQLENRQYLVEEYTLADVAHAGTFPRLREVADRGDAPLKQYPNVMAWVEQVESRESYKASV